tara:strand:+ start:505 stop:1746 length:1242 start_codon:yes stop_codon:yes gene_type:complete
MSTAGSIKPSTRITTIDVIRGVAVLGILLLNVQTFAMPFEAYSNPTAYGDLEGLNYWVWYFTSLLGDQKFMTIFSMLFGAGLILFTDRLEQTGRPAVALHCRRMGWLLLIGLLHAYLIWYGDILVSYAICGLVVIWMRKLPSLWMLLIGIMLLIIPFLIFLSMGGLLLLIPADQKDPGLLAMMDPFKNISQQLEAYSGSYVGQFEHRVPAALMAQTFVMAIFSFGRVCGLMLIGMVCYRKGLFSGTCSVATYAWLLAIGILFGIPIVWWGIEAKWEVEWEFIRSEFLLSQFNYWGSILIAFGWIALTVLFVKSGMLDFLRHALSCVGRMALSNYLIQSLACSLIFYGHGLGYFGEMERTSQFLLVLVISAAQLVWSPLWLSYFRFGPFEWLWRCLTYWSVQPIRKMNRVIPEA